jgi:hypothetical protein
MRRAAVTPGFQRAEEDLAAGRLWKARDRVNGLLRNGCADQDVLDLAARVYFAMGDHPRAGLHWFMTDVSGINCDQAGAAMAERYGSHSRALAEALPLRASFDCYPPAVCRRLTDLAASVSSDARPWPAAARIGSEPRSAADKEKMTMSFLVVMTIGVWIIGLLSIVAFVVLWLAGAF